MEYIPKRIQTRVVRMVIKVKGRPYLKRLLKINSKCLVTKQPKTEDKKK